MNWLHRNSATPENDLGKSAGYEVMKMTTPFRTQAGRRTLRGSFTLVELLVVISIIMILMSMLMPSLARAKAKAQQIKCVSNMRQLCMAAGMYASDHNSEFPARGIPTNAWPHKLKPFFIDWQIIICPRDSFGVIGLLSKDTKPKRSFLINGFNDFFMKNLSKDDYRKYQHWQWPHGMKESDIPRPTDTVLFGEKRKGSFHAHMDIDQGQRGNDFEEIDHTRHGRGSNFAFADKSVRLLSKNQELYPENLWAVMDEFRFPPAPPK